MYVFNSSQINLRKSSSQSSVNNSISSCLTNVCPSVHVVVANTSSSHCCNFPTVNKPNLFDLWHNRLGYPCESVVKTILSKCNIPKVNKNPTFVCRSCCLGKVHKFPFSNSTTIYTKPLILVHSNLWGSSPAISSSCYRYCIHFLDAFSRFIWLY